MIQEIGKEMPTYTIIPHNWNSWNISFSKQIQYLEFVDESVYVTGLRIFYLDQRCVLWYSGNVIVGANTQVLYCTFQNTWVLLYLRVVSSLESAISCWKDSSSITFLTRNRLIFRCVMIYKIVLFALSSTGRRWNRDFNSIFTAPNKLSSGSTHINAVGLPPPGAIISVRVGSQLICYELIECTSPSFYLVLLKLLSELSFRGLMKMSQYIPEVRNCYHANITICRWVPQGGSCDTCKRDSEPSFINCDSKGKLLKIRTIFNEAKKRSLNGKFCIQNHNFSTYW